MMKTLLLLFALNAGAGAITLNPFTCMEALSSRLESARLSSEAGLKQVLGVMRSQGVKELLAPLDEGRFRVTYQAVRLPGQSPVSGRHPWIGKPVLKVRGFGFADELEKQKLIWQTAVALFELQTRDKLWSIRSMLSPVNQRDFDLSMAGSDENFDYFLREMPKEWRDFQLKRLEVLEDELYTLFSALDLLDAKQLFPKNDPGRFWSLKAVYGGDASQSIAPNQADFESWKQGKLVGILGRRHGGNLLFNYYMNFVKRAVILSMAAQLAAFAPEVRNIPSYLDAFYQISQISQQIDESPAKAQELRDRYQANLRRQVEREEARLIKEITRQNGLPKRDSVLLAELEKDLNELYESYTWLNHRR